MRLAARHLSVHAAIAGNVNRYGAPKSGAYSISGTIASDSLMRSAIFLAHTEDEIRLGRDLQELDAYVCGDD